MCQYLMSLNRIIFTATREKSKVVTCLYWLKMEEESGLYSSADIIESHVKDQLLIQLGNI